MPGGRPAGPRASGFAASGAGRGSIARRAALRAGGAVALAPWAVVPPAALAAANVDAAVAKLLAGREPASGHSLLLDLPASFEYGTTIPLAVTVDSPMTAADHVRRVSVLAGGNPFPEVASIAFTPANGRARASTRIRLNEGVQEVVAVAELSDGRAILTRRSIKVAVSGCSSESGVTQADAMPPPRPRLKAPAEARRGEIVELSTMISHWMETGLRTDEAGRPIPRRIIHRVACARDGEPVFAADLTPAIAANAYWSFPLLARESAVLTFSWLEDGGGEYRASHALRVI